MQLKKTVIPYLNTAVRELQNLEQSQEIRLPDGMPDISKILGSWGQPILRSKEWRSDSILFSGGIMIWVMYAPEDQTGPKTMDAWVPFQIKWELPEQVPEGKISVSCSVRFVDARSISPRRIMVRAGLSAVGQAYTPAEAEVFAPEKMPEDVELLQRKYPIRLPCEAGEKTFLIDEELNIPGEDFTTETPVYYTLCPVISDQKVVGNKIAFRGTGNLHVLFSAEDGSLSSRSFMLPFSQFAELDQSYGSEADVDIQLCVTNLELDADEEGLHRVKSGITAQYVVCDRILMETIEDAYSTEREILLTRDSVSLPAILDQRREILVADAVLPEGVDNAADISFFADYPRQQKTDGGILVETQGIAQILCYDNARNISSCVSRWSSQTVVKTASEMAVSNFYAGEPQLLAGGTGPVLRTELPFTATVLADSGFPVVTGLEPGEEKVPDPGRPSLILCRVGENGLWSIAKSSGSTVDAIRKANSLEGEPAAGQMLLIPIL